MIPRMFLVGILVLSGHAALRPARADDPSKDAPPPRNKLNDLSLEVTALQMLNQFQFTSAQMKNIREWMKETTEKGRQRQPGQASTGFRRKLLELHTALVNAADQDVIEQLSDAVEDLRYEEKPRLDDNVVLTPEARRHAPELLRLLKTSQYAAYAALLIDLVDPLDFLIEALPRVRELQGADWRDKRAKIAGEIGRLVGGVDAAREEKVIKAVAALLTRARRLSATDFAEQRAGLEKTAQHILGAISPADVLRNEIEYSLAELLSNARLPTALAARSEL